MAAMLRVPHPESALTATEDPSGPWGLVQRVAFRFAFAYLGLYCFPVCSGLVNVPDWMTLPMDKLWQAIVPWAGKHVLHLARDITVFTNGSGDTTYDYVRVLCMAVLAALAAGVWSVLDRRRPDYRRLHAWLHVYLRYVLAMAMLTYGLVKVIKLQFPSPSLGRLTQPYGESSPMGLLWTFMGFSTAYTFFAGAGEVLGGLLLFFRRTTTLGALVVIGVMSNVVMLNFSYDVPVKLGSSHLLLFAIFLLLPDLRRLANLLLFNRPAGGVDLGPHLKRPWLVRLRMMAKPVLIATFLVYNLYGAWQGWKESHAPAPDKAMDGAYQVESFPRNGTYGSLWRSFIVRGEYVRLYTLDGTSHLFKTEGDPAKGPFDLLPLDDAGEKPAKPAPVGRLTLTMTGTGQYALEGNYEGSPITATLRKQQASDFPLMKRGFHWISENPYNR